MTAKSKKAAEPRRANKPLMEKRRRARINQSLLALKTLILDSAKSENTKHSKLEKADILELTVRHFQRHRSLDTAGVHQYRAGYSDCVKEVQRYLETPDAQTMTVMDAGVRQRLIHHLENCVSEVELDLRPSLPCVEDRLQPPDSSTIEEINNNKNSDGRITSKSSPLPMEGNEMFTSSQNLSPSSIDEVKTTPSSCGNTTKPTMTAATTTTTTTSDCFEVNDVLAASDSKNLPTKVLKTNDGNFVFVLPSHYLQLANALGINLKDYRSESTQDALSSVSVKCEPEKPLDFSKNNENDSMWRPW